MARLLIKAQDGDCPNQASCYKRGDVVVVMPDSHQWGAMEGLPAFLQIDVIGASVESLQHLSMEDKERPEQFTSVALRKLPNLFREVSRTQQRLTITRRQFRLELDGIALVNGHADVATITETNKRVL